ncbi:MAG: hypothetical protein KKC99_08075, partial [Proteobacteria bacterium]|nr:hypothetical protein [Pseudomonadota bacterium]
MLVSFQGFTRAKRHTLQIVMLTQNYQFALFSSQGRLVLNLHTKGWVLLVIPFLLCALAAANYVLFGYYNDHQNTLGSLSEIDKERLQVNEAMLSSSFELTDIENTLARVVDFNAKLRIMLSIGDEIDREATLSFSPRSTHGLRHLPALYGRNLNRKLRSRAQELNADMIYEETQQQEIAHSISLQLENLATIPVIMPTRGRFSSAFGWRKDPFKG